MPQSSGAIGKLEIVPVRAAFPHEALRFTTWLEENIEALADRIGLQIRVVEREKAVGPFNVDLLCEDGEGNRIIIENQLERTDHDHLGKLLTYLVNLEAKTAIWVTPEPRPEHERVIDWLNESIGADFSFYLVKIEAGRIGASPFAPLFTVVTAPDEQTREIGEAKKELSDRHIVQEREQFWIRLLEKARGRTRFSSKGGGRYQNIYVRAGKPGIIFSFTVTRYSAYAELYIDHDHDTGEKNKAIFDALYAEKDAIEAEFGEPLDWRRLDDKRACRILKLFDGGLRTPDRWDDLQEAMIDAMIRLDAALRPRIAKIQL